MALQQRLITSRTPGGMKRDQIERRRVGRPIVGRVRYQLEMGKLSIANLVQYLAGLSITIGVLVLCLERAQDVERAASEIRIDQQVL